LNPAITGRTLGNLSADPKETAALTGRIGNAGTIRAETRRADIIPGVTGDTGDDFACLTSGHGKVGEPASRRCEL